MNLFPIGLWSRVIFIYRYMENMERICPVCSKIIQYKNKISYKKALKEKKPCVSCTAIKRFECEEERRKASERTLKQFKEKGNPFKGKKHTQETKDRIAKKISSLVGGKNNPMYGKSFYQSWVDKYGKEIADKKMRDYKEKKSIEVSGKNNPMYGKPSPKGSGNGWSGWYNGWYFRSLIELSYMVNVIERFNLNWESAEKNKWVVKYEGVDGNMKNYFPDFVINNKYLVECKPKNLWGSKINILKKEAAENFCENKKMKYKLTEVRKLTDKELLDLYQNGKIKFIERYEQKFKSRYLSN